MKSAYILFFTILNIPFIFSSQVLFWGLGYSVRRSMLCLIDKSSQFCNTGNKYEVEKITCAFGRRLRMSTMSAVHCLLTYTDTWPEAHDRLYYFARSTDFVQYSMLNKCAINGNFRKPGPFLVVVHFIAKKKMGISFKKRISFSGCSWKINFEMICG